MTMVNEFFLQRLKQDAAFARSSGRIADSFFVADVSAALDRIDELEKYAPRAASVSSPSLSEAPSRRQLSTGNTHELKCWPPYFDVILSGVKPFEIRSEADRQFAVGDMLLLREWNPALDRYTGRSCGRRVSYILRGFPGIEPDYAILGFPND